VLQTARRFFSWARKQKLIKENPAADLEAPVIEKTRSRLLNDAEISAFWAATGSMGYPFGPCLRLLLLTGQRLRIASEAKNGELEEAGKRAGLWRIPRERTKNGKLHLLPIGPAAKEVLRVAAKTTPSKTFLFSTDDTPISGWSKKKSELDRLMLIQLRLAEKANGKDSDPIALPDWVFHDLRRTMSTLMVDRCDVLPEIAALIRHNLPKNADETDVIYMLSRREKEMRTALAAWEGEIMRIVEPKRKGRGLPRGPLPEKTTPRS
jgi:integrase